MGGGLCRDVQCANYTMATRKASVVVGEKMINREMLKCEYGNVKMGENVKSLATSLEVQILVRLGGTNVLGESV